MPSEPHETTIPLLSYVNYWQLVLCPMTIPVCCQIFIALHVISMICLYVHSAWSLNGQVQMKVKSSRCWLVMIVVSARRSPPGTRRCLEGYVSNSFVALFDL